MQNKNLFVNSGKKSQMMVLWLLAGMYTVPNAVEFKLFKVKSHLFYGIH